MPRSTMAAKDSGDTASQRDGDARTQHVILEIIPPVPPEVPVATSVGFPILYMTGAGTAASRTGQPDLGLATMTEMAESAGRIAATVFSRRNSDMVGCTTPLRSTAPNTGSL